jgi:hypothetical protein
LVLGTLSSGDDAYQTLSGLAFGTVFMVTGLFCFPAAMMAFQ